MELGFEYVLMCNLKIKMSTADGGSGSSSSSKCGYRRWLLLFLFNNRQCFSYFKKVKDSDTVNCNFFP